MEFRVRAGTPCPTRVRAQRARALILLYPSVARIGTVQIGAGGRGTSVFSGDSAPGYPEPGPEVTRILIQKTRLTVLKTRLPDVPGGDPRTSDHPARVACGNLRL